MAQVTENGISAIGKLLAAHGGSGLFDPAPHLVRWLSMLPVEIDHVEARTIHRQLCQFIESHSALMLGAPPTFERLPHILNVIGSALETELVDAGVTAQFGAILRRLSGALPGDVLQAAFAAVASDEARARLQRAVSQ